MRTKLIAALRAAANEVELNPDGFNWEKTAKCNCGIVAAHLLGLDTFELSEELKNGGYTEGSSWAYMAANIEVCQQSGSPIPSIIARLLNAGMNVEEFDELEDLKNNQVVSALGARLDYEDPQSFIAYARKWADMMESGVLE